MQDDKDDKFDLRVKQIFIPLLSGFVGMVAYGVLSKPTDLFGDTMNALLIGFFTMIATIPIVTYQHKRQREREKRINQNN